MKLVIEEHGRAHKIEVDLRDREVTATVDGREYRLEVDALTDGGLLLVHEGRVCECRVQLPSGQQSMTRVTVGPREYEFQVRDPRRLADHTRTAGSEGAAQLVSLMPGKIVRILVEVGQEVEVNESVLVVEAMKMQNELRSPRAGIVRELRVATGHTVNGGDILAVIE